MSQPLLSFVEPPPGPPASAGPLVGRRVALRPVTPEDYPYLFRLSLDPRVTFRWRLRSATPTYEAFVAGIGQGVLVQHLVVLPDGAPVGLVTVYNADLRIQVANLALLLDPAVQRTRIGVDALVLFLNHVFTAWSLRKVYAETTELSYGAFASGAGRFFEVEGTHPEHEVFAGRTWTMYVLAFYRERWLELAPRWLPRVADVQVAADPGAEGGALGGPGRGAPGDGR